MARGAAARWVCGCCKAAIVERQEAWEGRVLILAGWAQTGTMSAGPGPLRAGRAAWESFPANSLLAAGGAPLDLLQARRGRHLLPQPPDRHLSLGQQGREGCEA